MKAAVLTSVDAEKEVKPLQYAAFLTKHHKVPLVAPALAEVGIMVQLTDLFDTDSLGSFSGEIARTLSPLDCVKTKAKMACELTGLSLGIGSEGSFGGGPVPGLLNWDDELLCLYNSVKQRFIIARASGPVPLFHLETDQLAQLRAHLEKHDKAQGWICSFSNGIVKGLVGFAAVYDALEQHGVLLSSDRLSEVIRVAPDLRAHICPSRQHYIQQAATQLAERLRAVCPLCQASDFWRKEVETGLPCSACHCPTPRVKRYLKKCDCCGHTEYEASAEPLADPSYCPFCNP